jgi:hypothetical protein
MSSLSKDTWIKLILWAIAIIFAGGSLYYQQTNTAERVSSLSGDIDEHVDLIGHPVIVTRADEIEEEIEHIQTKMIEEQRLIRTEQQRAAENISSICQVTGANCR